MRFQHPCALLVVAQLGVDGAVAQADGVDGVRSGLEKLPLHFGRLARRGDIESLFEVRAFQRVRFVEDRKWLEPAGGDQPFDGKLAARDVVFDLDFVLAHPLNAIDGGGERDGVIGADHAAAGGEAQGFEHAGEAREVGARPRPVEARNAQAGRPEERSREVLVVARAGGGGGVEGQVAQARGFGGEHRGTVADRGHAIEPAAAEGIERPGDVVEANRDGAVTPGVVENVAAIGGERQVDTHAARGIGEDADLVSGGGGEEEETLRH